MLKAFLNWGKSSLWGHLVLSLVAVAAPLLLLGLITNIRAGYPTADLGMLVFLSILAAICPAFFIWYCVTAPRRRRRASHRNNSV